MSRLIDKFREAIGKDSKLGSISVPMPSYRTGFDVLDYRNAQFDEFGDLTLGLDGGKAIMLIGKPGTGKTTLGLQIAANIVEPFENGQIIHLDFERATKKNRIASIAGWNKEMLDEKYIHLDHDINTESVYKLVKSLAKIKKENSAELLLGTGNINQATGKEIMAYPPTVIILDSLAVMAPDTVEESEEMSGQMSATAIAKANTQLYKRIMGSLTDVNIILIAINHINVKIDISAFSKTQAQVNFLKQDETIPGGMAPIFLSNYLFKLISSDKLVPDKEFGIKGFKVILELVKSRSAAAGLTLQLVFDQAHGFSNLLSNYLLLKDEGAIKGGGRGYFLDSCPDVKFSQKDFQEKYYNSEELQTAFNEKLNEILMKYVPDSFLTESSDSEESESTELTFDEQSGFYTDGNGNYYDDNGNQIELEVEEDSNED